MFYDSVDTSSRGIPHYTTQFFGTQLYYKTLRSVICLVQPTIDKMLGGYFEIPLGGILDFIYIKPVILSSLIQSHCSHAVMWLKTRGAMTRKILEY